MPARLNTACLPRARRSSTPGANTSVSTTSTVGSRIRCLARSRRRAGTVTLIARAVSAATRWRPMKPEPPTTRTLSNFIAASGQLVFDRFDASARRDAAEARLQRGDFLVEQRAVEHRVRHHLLHVL